MTAIPSIHPSVAHSTDPRDLQDSHRIKPPSPTLTSPIKGVPSSLIRPTLPPLVPTANCKCKRKFISSVFANFFCFDWDLKHFSFPKHQIFPFQTDKEFVLAEFKCDIEAFFCVISFAQTIRIFIFCFSKVYIKWQHEHTKR